ncbi:MAG: hypothetical protein D6824_07440 [Planctomycetota bacterium]|nr:MAG: hypothetical protein D6824_07440 [Planctomycetota bacterium]
MLGDKQRAMLTTAGLTAGVVVVAGVLWLSPWRRRTPPPPEHEALSHENRADLSPNAAAVADVLEKTAFVEPDARSVPRIASTIREHVRQALQDERFAQVAPPQRREDLLNLVEQRIALLLEHDFDAYHSMIRARGGVTPASDPEKAATYRKAISNREKAFHHTRIDPDHVRVRVLFHQGKPVDTLPQPPKVIWSDEIFDIPDDPVKGGLDVVEVMVPIYAPKLVMHPQSFQPTGTKPAPAVVGFAYAWSESRRQWLPYRTHLYYTDGNYMAPSFP